MEKLKEWKGTIELLGFAAIAGATLAFVRGETLDKIEHLITRIVEDPMAAAGVVVAIIGALRTVQIAWQRDPNAKPVEVRPSRPPSRTSGHALIDALLFIVALACAAFLHGCGASAETRNAYALEQARCYANERAIVDRSDSTEAQDRADWALERARCDAALLAIGGE
jgi:hypothetical protein